MHNFFLFFTRFGLTRGHPQDMFSVEQMEGSSQHHTSPEDGLLLGHNA
jgi:hypothetical protein